MPVQIRPSAMKHSLIDDGIASPYPMPRPSVYQIAAGGDPTAALVPVLSGRGVVGSSPRPCRGHSATEIAKALVGSYAGLIIAAAMEPNQSSQAVCLDVVYRRYEA